MKIDMNRWTHYRYKSFPCLAILTIGLVFVPAPLSAQESSSLPETQIAPESTKPSAITTPAAAPSNVSPQPQGQLPGQQADAPPTTPPGSMPDADSVELSTAEPPQELQKDAAASESRGGYRNQPAFVPDEVRPQLVDQGASHLATAKSELYAAEAELQKWKDEAAEIEQQKAGLDAEMEDIVSEFEKAEDLLQKRAIAIYMSPTGGHPTPTLDYEDIHETIVQNRLVSIAKKADSDIISRFDGLEDQLTTEAQELVDASHEIQGQVSATSVIVEEKIEAVSQAEIELASYQLAGQFYVPGAVFPVAGPYSVPLINSFGFARMTGSGNQHWHEGIDIFAPMGSPLVAAEQGVVTGVGSGSLGGRKLWVEGVSGTRWYYAHLNDFAPGLHNGQKVNPGDLVGYVGDSGNAKGTPPHLHMEIHPPGSRVANPYPQLKVLSDRELSDRDRKNSADGDDQESVYDLQKVNNR